MSKPSKNDIENGKALASRLSAVLRKASEIDIASEEEWGKIYSFLQEYQLLGLALMVLEAAEEYNG